MKLQGLAVLICFLASGAWCIRSATVAWSARGDSRRAVLRLVGSTRDAEELVRLRSGIAASAHEKQPETALVGAVSSVLVAAGLPSSTMSSLNPETSTVADGMGLSPGGPTFRRQLARLTLEPLSLPHLGKFLARWRESQPEWTVRSIELTPRTALKRGEATEDLSAHLVLETTFLDHSRRTP